MSWLNLMAYREVLLEKSFNASRKKASYGFGYPSERQSFKKKFGKKMKWIKVLYNLPPKYASLQYMVPIPGVPKSIFI